MKPTNNQIDTKLDQLLEQRKPGETMTPSELARACGCSPQYMNQLLKRALQKAHKLAQKKELKCLLD